VKDSLKNLEKASKNKENVMPYLVECCKAYATVGEMANVFREVFGEYVEPNIF
jgi:methylmalonyl-CoA mutase N-terminal domain/subunit